MRGVFVRVLSLLSFGLRSTAARPGPCSIVVLGVAGAAFTLSVLCAVTAGLRSAIIAAGHADRVLVLRRGAGSELESGIAPRVREIAAARAEVVRDTGGAPLVSEEIVRVLDVRTDKAGATNSLPIRGVGAEFQKVRPELRIVAGRMFTPGTYELILGRAAADALGSFTVGSSIEMKGVRWKVVGVFTAAGSSYESEMFTDGRTIQSFYQAPNMSSVTVRLRDPAAFTSFKSGLESSPDVAVQVARESDYYAALSTRSSAPLKLVVVLVGGLMGIAAVFLAMNAIHSALSARTVEIATLRALGFEGRVVAASSVLEVGILAGAGAALGSLVAWIVCRNSAMSLLTGDARLSQTAFHLQLTSQDLARAIVYAVVIGLLGGLPSAIRAARQPVVEGLRAP